MIWEQKRSILEQLSGLTDVYGIPSISNKSSKIIPGKQAHACISSSAGMVFWEEMAVSIYALYALRRGRRVLKIDTTDYHSFAENNAEPVVIIDLMLYWELMAAFIGHHTMPGVF